MFVDRSVLLQRDGGRGIRKREDGRGIRKRGHFPWTRKNRFRPKDGESLPSSEQRGQSPRLSSLLGTRTEKYCGVFVVNVVWVCRGDRPLIVHRGGSWRVCRQVAMFILGPMLRRVRPWRGLSLNAHRGFPSMSMSNIRGSLIFEDFFRCSCSVVLGIFWL